MPSLTQSWTYDAHGNMVAMLSRSGTNGYALSNQRTFDAWGNVRIGATAGNPTGRYCANIGHRQDDESGLIYMRARYYEPTSGRFVSEDPGNDGGNWYTYCRNNPVNLIDRNGENPLILIGAILGAISGFLIGLSENKGWGITVGKLFIGAIAGAIAGAVSIFVGPMLVGILGEGLSICASGALGGAAGSFIGSVLSDLLSGKGVNWGRAARAAGIGGALGFCFGALGAAAQRNAEIAGWLAGIDADLIGNACDSFNGYADR